MPTQPTEPDLGTFAGRRAAREAAEAAGQTEQKWQNPTLRAGIDQPTPLGLEVRHVRA